MASRKHRDGDGLPPDPQRESRELPKADPPVTPYSKWTLGNRGWRIVALAVLLLLAAQLRYSERRAVREREEVVLSLRAEERRRASVESERERQAGLVRQLEAECDQLRAALRLAAQPGEPTASGDQTPTGGQPDEPGQAQKSDLEAAPTGAPTGGGERSPGILRADFGRVMPQLVAALKPVERQGRKGLLIDKTGTLPIELQRLGLLEGDVITNIDRLPAGTAVQFARALESFRKEDGFALRVVRGEQTAWLRVNILDAGTAKTEQPEKVDESPPPVDAEEEEPSQEAMPN